MIGRQILNSHQFCMMQYGSFQNCCNSNYDYFFILSL